MNAVCPVCSGPMVYKSLEWQFHGYECVDKRCGGFSKCDNDCCRIMSPETAFNLIVAENKIPTGHRQERIRQLLSIVHQHGREQGVRGA